MSNIFNGFLSLENCDKKTQERILKHGLRYEDVNLLSKLAQYSGLDKDIDEELRDVPFAGVKAAWASRSGRTVDDLISLVSKEKRVKVHAALAEREDLPQELYLVIANKAKGKGALMALILNNASTNESKEVAGKRLIDMLEENEDGERYLDHKTSSEVGNILSAVPSLVKYLMTELMVFYHR